MGCHIWFARPVTDDEFQLMKEYAVTEAELYLKDGFGSKDVVRNIARSVETGEACVNGLKWYEYGYGQSNPKLTNFDGALYLFKGRLYIGVDGFNNVARVSIGIYTYPHKIIHNKKELRRYIGKRYFNITKEEHERLTEFWKKYPDGIMHWG